MNFKEYVLDYCDKGGMFHDQAEVVLGMVMMDRTMECMVERWDDDVSSYPTTILAFVTMTVRKKALEYIDGNLPYAWFRSLFQDMPQNPEKQ